MISAAFASASANFLERLETDGARAVQVRARSLSEVHQSGEHPWRSPSALWPDYGLE